MNNLINKLKDYKYKFIDDIFKRIISTCIENTFKQLINDDIIILSILTSYIIDDIIIRYNLGRDIESTKTQFTQKNGRDIISLCLTLLPFIDNIHYIKITKLQEILFYYNKSYIESDILSKKRTTVLKEYFPYSNFSLGLLNNDNDKLLDLYINSEHLIYTCIHNNFIAILETIKITNGKLFINWINTTPMINYIESDLYKTSEYEINNIIKIVQHKNYIDIYNKLLQIIGSTTAKTKLENIKNEINDTCLSTKIDIIIKSDNIDMEIKKLCDTIDVLPINEEMEIMKQIDLNKGLWLGDYYNILTNGYYVSIKQIKWVIFCKKIIVSPPKYYYTIQYLNEMFDNNIDIIFQYIDYNSMTEATQLIFKNKLDLIYNNLKHNITCLYNIEYEFELFKSLFIFMKNNFTDKKFLDKSFDNFNISILYDSADIDDDENITGMNEDVVLALEYLTKHPDYLWKYIKETFVILKASIYSKYLIKDNKINMEYFNFNNHDINLKNIYNIAKLLCHTNNTNFMMYSIHFKGLFPDQIYDFFNRYCNNNINWINIKKNIQIQEGTFENYDNILIKIKKSWNLIKKELIWDYLRYNGLLSHFRVSINAISNNILKDRLKNYFTENKTIFDENYFMTNDSYNKLHIYDKDKLNNKILFSELLLKKDSNNYLFYANDWISLLNFFNHYINHSIIYVTGSTGTGKSTQVPKLTLYALKMYDYKLDGRVVCTQPRIVPTQDNAKRIASEMGLPIMTFSKLDYKTNNYYLQYKHNDDKHTKELCGHLTLKMVTDGSLLSELIQYPLLKTTYKMPKLDNKQMSYSNTITNKYDIVIVDEAHEHNTNMDIILTLMRQTCLYNNSIRLIIVSATMDDDEPIYRSYYKLINDNIVFPIKQPILHPILKIPFLIDAIYLDRRMNISPPGETTQYKVIEIYNELIEENYGLDEKKNSLLAQIDSYRIVNMICNKSISGDILLFSTGEREIIDAVNTLNNTLPEGTIALPYYGSMNTNYRDIISNINNMIGTIQNKRNMIGEQWGAEYKIVKDVSIGTYKRAVIIATNVAEASITIQSLKYVVDTGYSKVNRYDTISDSFNMSIEKISESSRLQRKGRVGRVGEGTVYFTYGKGKRKDVAPKFTITLGDFHTTFLQLATKNIIKQDNNNLELWDKNFSPYLPENEDHCLSDNIKTLFGTDETYKTKYINIINKNIYNIILSQFLLTSTINRYESIYNIYQYYPINISSYFYNFNEYKIDTFPKYFDRYIDGYKSEQLFDKDGSFYIVHPFEDRLERNIMGQIINYKYKNYTSSKSILDNNIYSPLRNNMKVKMLYLSVNKKDIHRQEYKKTEYFDKLNNIITLMNNQMSEQESNILLLGAGYDIIIETCMVLSLIKSMGLQPNISSLIKQTGKFIDMEPLKKLFGSDSDITSLYMITNQLSHYFKTLELFNFIEQYKKNNSMDKSEYYIKYIELKNIYYKKEYKKLGSHAYNLFNWLHHNGKIESHTGFLYWLNKSNLIQTKIKVNIINNKMMISNICTQLHLNESIILIYLEKLLLNVLSIVTSKKDDDENLDENVFDWVKKLRPTLLKNLTNNSIEFKLNLCFFFAQPLIAVRNNTHYMSMKDGSDIFPSMLFNQANTLCNSLGNYIYYYVESKKQMMLLINIDPSILPIYYSIHYNTDNIKMNYMMYSNDDNKYIIKTFNNSEWIRLVEIVQNNWSYSRFPFNNTELSVVQEFIKNI